MMDKQLQSTDKQLGTPSPVEEFSGNRLQPFSMKIKGLSDTKHRIAKSQ